MVYNVYIEYDCTFRFIEQQLEHKIPGQKKSIGVEVIIRMFIHFLEPILLLLNLQFEPTILKFVLELIRF